MKIYILALTLLISIMDIGCKKDAEIDLQSLPELDQFIGEYNLMTITSSYSEFSGSTIDTVYTTGRIEKFKGISGNHDNSDHKLGIRLDNNNSDMIVAQSCYKNLMFSYLHYVHPTVSLDGELTYPEYMCYPWGYNSNFSGELTNDSLYLNYGYGDATFNNSTSVLGKKII